MQCLFLMPTCFRHELWSLLNFLLPDLFASSEIFDSCFNLSKASVNKQLLSKVHNVLRPLMVRLFCLSMLLISSFISFVHGVLGREWREEGVRYVGSVERCFLRGVIREVLVGRYLSFL